MKELSPKRHSSKFESPEELAREQAEHFGIDPESEYGNKLVSLAISLYEANRHTHDLWQITMDGLASLDRNDRLAWFNAKRFISFQLAKVLDNLQNPLRATYQSLNTQQGQFMAKGAYPLFDNVSALFSASPVITRTATYLFACSEWVEDAFKGREPLHEIYSRLLNPTSIALANHIVDIEAGKRANEYLAWNFNSGMAAIDATLSHLVGHRDIVLASRNVYGGTFQLLNDWYGNNANMDVAVEWVDGFTGKEFAQAMDTASDRYADRITEGRQIYIYLESPCNPHGYILDVPAICVEAHRRGWRVIADTTVGTPFLYPVLQRDDEMERPDFVIHSYTKDIAGNGATTAGVVIGRNEDMFIPKGDSVTTKWPDGRFREACWNQTLFWNVYYVKGAFLDADKAYEVLNGMKTLELRMLQKAINTTTLAQIFHMHPDINVSCPVLDDNENVEMLNQMYLSMPAPLFTINFDTERGKTLSRAVLKQFYDLLEPAIGMQVSLGQTNTVALCPAMTTHSEMSDSNLRDAGITPSTMRIAVGLEDPRQFVAHMQRASEITLDAELSGFSEGFPSPEEIDSVYREVYSALHFRFIDARPSYQSLLE
ncbi:PLP-dependent transferase [Parasalinivibrio latis]|uniref:PLP-dependent transferase n=1 Tax=Parasalinivibrio latis TaxID=2952610 RepID=UPI0030DE0487